MVMMIIIIDIINIIIIIIIIITIITLANHKGGRQFNIFIRSRLEAAYITVKCYCQGSPINHQQQTRHYLPCLKNEYLHGMACISGCFVVARLSGGKVTIYPCMNMKSQLALVSFR